MGEQGSVVFGAQQLAHRATGALLAQWLAPAQGYTDTTIALEALAVFLGHLYPVFFRFIGGKGVATAAGVLFALNPWLGLGLLVIWLVLAVGLWMKRRQTPASPA